MGWIKSALQLHRGLIMKRKIGLLEIVFTMLIVSIIINALQHIKILETQSSMDIIRDKYIELYKEVEK